MSITYDNKPLAWNNEGIEPNDSLKQEGWQAGYKPPAEFFNYQWHNTFKCLAELQEKTRKYADDTDAALTCIEDSTEALSDTVDRNFDRFEKVEDLVHDDSMGNIALYEKIEDNEKAIDVLNGSGEGSVDKRVADKVAEIVAGAPKDFDTLKEISDWISKHGDSAAAMNTQIQKNASDISQIKSDISDFDIPHLRDLANTATNDIDLLEEEVSSVKTSVDTKADKNHTHIGLTECVVCTTAGGTIRKNVIVPDTFDNKFYVVVFTNDDTCGENNSPSFSGNDVRYKGMKIKGNQLKKDVYYPFMFGGRGDSFNLVGNWDNIIQVHENTYESI